MISPVQAEVVPIDPTQPPVTALSLAEARKIAALQNPNDAVPFSEISPDDKSLLTVFVVAGKVNLAFLNIQDGSTIPVKFGDTGPLSPFTQPVWRDNQTVVYISVSNRQSVLVALDRTTGNAKITPFAVPGFPLGFSPNASRLLVVIQDGPAANPRSSAEQEEGLVSPFKLEIKRGFENGTKSAFENWNKTTFDKTLQPLRFAEDSLTLAVLDLNAGSVAPLYALPRGSGLVSISWSQDSSRLALVRTTIPNVSTEGTFLSDVATQDGLGQLPPDKNPFFLGSVVDTVDFSSGVKVNQALLKAAGGNGDTFADTSWSPNNSSLLVQMQKPSKLAGRANPVYLVGESSYLRFYSPDGQVTGTFEKDEINAPTGGVRGVFVSPDEVLLNAVRGTNVSIYYYNRASGNFQQLPTGEGTATQMTATHQSRQIVYAFSSFVQAPELYRINWDGSALSRLTTLNDDLTKAGKVRADPVSFTLANGQKRDGYLLQAAEASFPPKNVPLIFWQEGGPTAAYLNRWAANVENPFNLLPNFGFAVLFVPLEGRLGFGPARLNALADNRNFGQIDIDEGAEVVRQTIERGYTSRGKVGITGCSYGGYYVSQSISRHPDLYTAANTQCTLLDLFREFQFGQTPYISYLMGRASTTDPDEYVKDSPLFNSSKIRASTLIFAGINDFLPAQVSVTFHDQLQANGLAVNMYVFDKEGHGLRLPTSQLIAAQSQISWFRQFLGGSGGAPAAASQVISLKP